MSDYRTYRSTKKQITAVLEAVANGCETSDMVASFLGITIAIASANLTVLEQEGLIRASKRKGQRGIRFNRYVIASPR